MVALLAALVTAPLAAQAPARAAAPWRGVNLIQTPSAPYGSPAAVASLDSLAALGANAVALVPFLWQRTITDTALVRPDSTDDPALEAMVRAAHQRGLRVLLKPHVWVPGSWAGAIAMHSEDDWRHWFAAYQRALLTYAALAERSGAEMLAVGTELEQASHREEWATLIRALRAAYRGQLTYVAHGTVELGRVRFWRALDVAAVSVWPTLGTDPSPAGIREAVRFASDTLTRAVRALRMPVLVAEVGIRSARDALPRPWESPEERAADPDEGLQARVLEAWLTAFDDHSIRGVMVWRWFTDPALGGPNDTDFTPQRKAAQAILQRRWR